MASEYGEPVAGFSMEVSLVDQIDALLPQTQCTKCGYPACRAYAEAIARGEADIDQCPPGGAAGVAKLATLLGRTPKPLNPVYGAERPRAAALIDENWCIGCTLCIRACPVDAIVGARKRMHTVLAEHCTGCELCLPPCPVDCIQIVDLEELVCRGARIPDPGPEQRAARARRRYQFHQGRLRREREEREARLPEKAAGRLGPSEQDAQSATERKRAAVRAALERARARRGVAKPRCE
jgi:H+/Na+-translocating ferredoxin:NAD+ oxidoreductase subunit B